MKKWTCCSWRNVARFWSGEEEELLTERLRVSAGEVYLRLPRWSDGTAVMSSRARSQREIAEWEPDPEDPLYWKERPPAQQWRDTYRWLMEGRRVGVMVPFVIVLNGQIAGQVLLNNVEYGAVRGVTVGYWVDSRMTGGGVATVAAALAVDYAFDVMRLHRVQATVHPDNAASRCVLDKVAMRQEGVLQRYLRIKGRYLTHELWAVTAEELPQGAVGRLVAAGKAQRL